MSSNQSIEPEILSRYEVLEKLGSGAYGHVWKVLQKSTKKIYALKKIFEAFQHATDAQRTYRQISILKKTNHKNIVQLYEVFLAKNDRDIYLVFKYMSTDLYHAIYDKLLQDVHKKYVIYQLLIGVKYLHETGLIHRDLKPSNILLDCHCNSKICDFGLARLLGSNNKQNNVMTEGVATRWYRAPQVLLGSCSYRQQADIWSIGCIMAQMLIRNPMFPGSSTINQLQKILQFTGKPDHEDILSIDCQYAQKFIEQCGNIKQKTAKQYFGNSDPLLVSLIYKILQFNPQKRITIDEMLRHEYFSQIFDENDLRFGLKKKIELEINDNNKLTTENYKQLIANFDSRNKKNSQNLQLSIINSRNDSVKRNSRSPVNISASKISNNKLLEISPAAKSPQRFKQIKKNNIQPSFSKLLGSQKLKKRSDSRQDSILVDTQNKQKRNCQLFSDLIKNKDSNRNGSKSRSRLSDKQNIQSNNYNQINRVNINDCLKKFESTNTTSRVSFQGLKKTANLKFNR